MAQHSGQVYLRPCGLLWGDAAAQAVAGRKAGALAAGHTAFSLVELITRNGSAISTEIVTYKAIAASTDQLLQDHLERICRPRPPFAGLDFASPVIMGVINTTPDSFSDGGRFTGADQAIAHGRALAAAGAGILDVGGESTRPGAKKVPVKEELQRTTPVVAALAADGLIVSIDTRKSQVMRQAISAGAKIINDVTALTFDPAAMATARGLKSPVILMHSKGDPETMQNDPVYDNVVLDVYDSLNDKLAACVHGGIDEALLMIDPGIGFGKTFRHNLAILHNLSLFHALGAVLVTGVSRKAFIGALTGRKTAGDRMAGSLGAGLNAVMQAAQVLRVHDVDETHQALAVWNAIQQPDFALL